MNDQFKQKSRTAENGGKLRHCLVCGEDFLSQWAGNRVCKRCKATSNWRGGA